MLAVETSTGVVRGSKRRLVTAFAVGCGLVAFVIGVSGASAHRSPRCHYTRAQANRLWRHRSKAEVKRFVRLVNACAALEERKAHKADSNPPTVEQPLDVAEVNCAAAEGAAQSSDTSCEQAVAASLTDYDYDCSGCTPDEGSGNTTGQSDAINYVQESGDGEQNVSATNPPPGCTAVAVGAACGIGIGPNVAKRRVRADAAALKEFCIYPDLFHEDQVYAHSVHIMSVGKTLHGFCYDGASVISTSRWGHTSWVHDAYCVYGLQVAHGSDGNWVYYGNGVWHSTWAHGWTGGYLGIPIAVKGIPICFPIQTSLTQHAAAIRVAYNGSHDFYNDYPNPYHP